MIMQNLIYIFQESHILFIFSVGFISLLIGSFLNVIISRLPIALQKEWRQQCEFFLATDDAENKKNLQQNNYILLDLLLPCSHCPICNTPIKPYDNIPIVSYILLRGKCRACNNKISLQYPLIEIITAILCMLVAYNFGVTWKTITGCFLTYVLIAQSGIDFKHKIIPDELTLPTLWIGIFISIWNIYTPSINAILGAIVGYTVLWGLYWLFYWITKKEGMGYGDFKLLAMLGAWLGWQALPLIIFLSSIIGSIIGVCTILFLHKNRNFQIPFGPFLAIAGWIALVWGPQINAWYIKYTGIF